MNKLTDIAKGRPQKVADSIIEALESQEITHEDLEDKDFHIDSTGWKERTNDQGILEAVNPEGDVVEVRSGEYTGCQYFESREAAIRETTKAGKRIPDDEQWQAIIDSAYRRGQKYDLSVPEVLKIKLAGSRYWNNGQYYDQGTYGSYWSSSPFSTGTYGVYFSSGGGKFVHSYNRGNGFSVRCLKN